MGAILSNRSASEGDDTGWMSKAHCAEQPPKMFYPKDIEGVEIARRFCRECKVKDDCLEYALERREDHGVWGGTSERERRRILKRRRLAQLHSAE